MQEEERDDIRLPPKWIDLNIRKRDCGYFFPSAEDEGKCQCGREKGQHGAFVRQIQHIDSSWNPTLHSVLAPTDAYGSLVFEGEHYPNKAHFVRLAHDTNPELVMQLMTLVWGLPMPQLVITVQGSSTNFHLSDRVGKLVQTGLVKAARSCSAWIFTNGLNDGVAKHVGIALSKDRKANVKSRGRVISVGFAPWGMVEYREELLVKNQAKAYNPLAKPHSKYRVLNPKHNNFLLVDNGSVGRVGGESVLRRRLEKHISRHLTDTSKGCHIPLVCVVIEGGLFTLRSVGDFLHDDPPTPVVVVAGSGRTADLLATIIKRAQTFPPGTDISSIKEEIFTILIKIYHINVFQCVVLLSELKRILSKSHLITVYNALTADESFDSVILGSIFRSQHWSPLQQLSLALVWNRVDLAESEVFVYGREWSQDSLESAMMEALLSNRLEFVSLLLEHGVHMQHFLTADRLETLYNSDKSEVLRLVVTRFRHDKRSSLLEDSLTIHDVGVALSHIMGHLYKSKYIHLQTRAGLDNDGTGTDGSIGETPSPTPQIDLTQHLHPFDELFVWAVLTKRHPLALLMWNHGEGALAKALVAIKLNRFIAERIYRKLNPNVALDFDAYAQEWERLSYELLDLCFKQDQKLCRQLLTMEQERWSKTSNLQMAAMSNHKVLLGHPSSQMLLADLWMGALNVKSFSTLKILLGIVFPFLVFFLEFKSVEELQLIHNHPGSGAEDAESEVTIAPSYYDDKTSSLFSGIFRPPLRQQQTPNKPPKPEEITAAIMFLEKTRASGRAKEKEAGDVEVIKTTRKSLEGNTVTLTIPERESPNNEAADDVSRITKTYIDRSMMKRRKPHRSSFVTTRQNLSAWKKFCEFQRAPVTNFYRHALAYVIFVVMFSYVILVPQDPDRMGIIETYVVVYLGTLAVGVFRDFLIIDSVNCSQKLVEFRTHGWYTADVIGISVFMTGVALRHVGLYPYGMLIYKVTSIYWNLRLFKFLGVHRFLGPKIVMMTKMLKTMVYFAIIVLVIIFSFGMARESIRFPNSNPTWRTITEAFLEPYVMMFGEVDIDSLAPQCDGDECPLGYWIIPLSWVMYMMVANILIVNVLIAVFNGIYSEVDAMALEIWLFQRFNFVLEVEAQSKLPPPFMIIGHIYDLALWLYRTVKQFLCEQELKAELDEEDGAKIIMQNDHRLKTFVTLAEATIVFDFEEDCLALLNHSANDGFVDGFGVGEPSSLTNFTFRKYDATTSRELAKDRQYQELRRSLQEIFNELESQKEKLDKVLSSWEAEQDADIALNSRTPSHAAV